eukprot:gene497-536_t
MGSAASINANSSPEDIATALGQMDVAYEPYGKAIVDKGVNGETLLATDDVDTMLGTLGFGNDDNHRDKLKQEFVRLKGSLKMARASKASPINSAFLFIKPHANNSKTQEYVRNTLLAKGLHIAKEGEFHGPEIDEKKLIDQHYYAIASKATLLAAKDLPVPAEKFHEAYGVTWADVLAEGKAFNALEAAKELGVDAHGLDELWNASKKVKMGGGFYCGEIHHHDKTIYTFNAFFMTMRSKFVAPEASVHYFVVEFDPHQLAWKDFRGKVLGPTDPKAAPSDSLRGHIYTEWQSFGLAHEPNTGDNCVHGSASPFEGLAEKMNWLGLTPHEDAFGAACLSAGLSEETLKAWSRDPQVNGRSVFDQLEDTDAAECIKRLVALNSH